METNTRQLIDWMEDEEVYVSPVWMIWHSDVEHPALLWLMDWLFGEMIYCREKAGQNIIAEARRRAVDGNWGGYTEKGRDWHTRASLSAEPQLGWRYRGNKRYQRGEHIEVGLVHGKRDRSPHTILSMKTTWRKLGRQDIRGCVAGYLRAWESCGERLPWLIAEGKCPIDLPKVQL